jgi:SHS family lactate transporter-like MFS transporter
MESLPPAKRGNFSGLLQEGYAVGNLLAGLTLALLYTHIGWRGMFALGAAPALLILFIRSHVPESPAWKAGAAERLALRGDLLLVSLRRYAPLFGYGMLLMAAFNFVSHASQDPYPTFLAKQVGFSPQVTGVVTAVAALGAIAGGICFGALSQRVGRRVAIVIAALLGAALIPVWVFSQGLAVLALGGFAMQFAVQGAWGIIPAHLSELAPPLVRGTFPGLTYQLGNLIAAGTLQFEVFFAAHRFATPMGPNYAAAMALFMLIGFGAVILMTLLGGIVAPERREAALSP